MYIYRWYGIWYMEHDICQIYMVWYLIYFVYMYGLWYISYFYMKVYYWYYLYVRNYIYIYISYTIDHFGSCKSSYCFFIFCPVRELFWTPWPHQSKRSQCSAITLPSLQWSSQKNHQKHPGIKNEQKEKQILIKLKKQRE